MKIHIVQKGDTLWNLAKQYDVDFEELKAANTQLADPEMIMPGMKIKIPGKTVPAKKETEKEEPKKEEPAKEGMKKKEPAEKPVKDMPEMPKKPELPKKEAAEPKKPEAPKEAPEPKKPMPDSPIMKPPPKKMPVMEAPKEKPEPSKFEKEMPQKPPAKPDKDKMKLPPKIQKPYFPKEKEKKEKPTEAPMYKDQAMEKPKTNMQSCKTCGQPTDMPSAHHVHYGPPQPPPPMHYMMPVHYPYHGGYQQPQAYHEGYDQYYHARGYGGGAYRSNGGEEPGYGSTAHAVPPYVPVYDPGLVYGYFPVVPYYEQPRDEQTYYPYAGEKHNDE